MKTENYLFLIFHPLPTYKIVINKKWDREVKGQRRQVLGLLSGLQIQEKVYLI